MDHKQRGQEQTWTRLLTFIHDHEGVFVLFGDMNEVRFEEERFESMFNSKEANVFNSSIGDAGLVEMELGGRWFTWMNKPASKMSQIDREYVDKVEVHDKLKVLKDTLKPWVNNKRNNDQSRIKVATSRLNLNDSKVDDLSSKETKLVKLIDVMAELNSLYDIEEKDIVQNAKVKWDVEGDENTEFFHGLLKQIRSKQAIVGLSLNGVWITDPPIVKNAFKEYYRLKFTRK
ncbi:uncharacterized protein [Rutidosis leptorrhynchoides]|uniref:uncharacterized protein n=1 Tax=Rutidosis leptorrhynchoides TaxID=125765 RepID=UPI003A98E50C